MDNRAVWSEQQQKQSRKRVLVILLVAILCLGAMSRFEFFGEYFSALWFHWIALMSGAVSVAITFWEKIHNSIGKYVLYTVAAMCVFLAGFQAWQDEHRKAGITLTEHLDWVGSGDVISVVGMENNPPVNIEAPGPMVYVLISVMNAGPPTVLENWRMRVIWPDGKEDSFWPNIEPPSGGNVVFKTSQHTFTWPKSAYLLTKATPNPIPSGGLIRGFLFYMFPPRVTLAKLKASKTWIISFDVRGTEHKLEINWKGNDIPEYPVFPGITDAQ